MAVLTSSSSKSEDNIKTDKVLTEFRETSQSASKYHQSLVIDDTSAAAVGLSRAGSTRLLESQLATRVDLNPTNSLQLVARTRVARSLRAPLLQNSTTTFDDTKIVEDKSAHSSAQAGQAARGVLPARSFATSPQSCGQLPALAINLQPTRVRTCLSTDGLPEKAPASLRNGSFKSSSDHSSAQAGQAARGVLTRAVPQWVYQPLPTTSSCDQPQSPLNEDLSEHGRTPRKGPRVQHNSTVRTSTVQKITRRASAFVSKTKLLNLAILSLLALFFAAPSAHADRLKDIANVRGVSSNSLVGYGLVVGLAGTGDNLQSVQTQQMMANILSRRFGTIITPNQIKAQNVAVVMVTAKLPPFSRIGSRLDVTVSSTSNAQSLFGGTLLPTALKGGNGKTFAWAEGPLSIGGFSASGGSGSSVTKNHPTVGQVPSGAVVAKELKYQLSADQPITIALKNPDFTTAARVSKAINQRLGVLLARAADPGTIRVDVPASHRERMVELIAAIENTEVTPDQAARVIINERTGTVVMGSSVRLSACAISHGSLTVQIDEQQAVSQPGPFAEGDTVTTPQTEIDVIEEGGDIRMIQPGPTLGEVVRTLNTLGVRPRDLVAILLALKQGGALQAQIEIQ